MYTDDKEYDLEKEYFPSLNTTRFQNKVKPNEYVLENFIEVGKAETDRVRAKYNIRENVRYAGEDDNQFLDIYYKEYEKDTPIFVFIHGGYWQFLDKSSAGSFVEPLVERNYRVIVVDYDSCPNVTLKDLIDQIWSCFKWIFQYAEDTNASEVIFSGHSAGAHLASLLLSSPVLRIPYADRTTSLFLMSGVYDLRELYNLDAVNPDDILSLTATTAEEFSPLCWDVNEELIEFYKNNMTKIHILIGKHESKTFIGQSRAYATKLEEAGMNATFKIFEKYDHFDILEEIPLKDSDIYRYLIENL